MVQATGNLQYNQQRASNSRCHYNDNRLPTAKTCTYLSILITSTGSMEVIITCATMATTIWLSRQPKALLFTSHYNITGATHGVHVLIYKSSSILRVAVTKEWSHICDYRQSLLKVITSLHYAQANILYFPIDRSPSHCLHTLDTLNSVSIDRRLVLLEVALWPHPHWPKEFAPKPYTVQRRND